MAGRYAKAPLVYMTAHIKTTSLPSLTTDQWAIAEQAMVKCGLPESVSGELQEVQLSLPSETNQEPTSTVNTVSRHGFFSLDRTNALILDPKGIEWRTTAYSRYDSLCHKFEEVIESLCGAVDAYKFIPAQELSLSYADIVAPAEGRSLSDYFAEGDSVLPLSMLKGAENDLQTLGHVQVNRIVEPDKRIFISLEELPTIEGKPSRFLPQSMSELDTNFSMPLNLQEDWTNIPSDHYALLTTQAALLTNTQLQDLRFRDACEPIHNLTRDTFKGLINRAVCDVDWKYIVDDSQGEKHGS